MIGDHQAAEDVTHDVFLAFVQRAGKLSKHSQIRPYLVTSCANKARDHLRRKQPIHLHERLIECPDRAAVEPVEVVVGEEQSSRLLELISRLPPEQREVLAMRIQGEMAFRDIAESTSCSINAVQSRYRYAVGTLRRMFHENDKEATSCTNRQILKRN